MYVLQADYGYGHGWEDETASDSRSEMITEINIYRSEAPQYRYRVITRKDQ